MAISSETDCAEERPRPRDREERTRAARYLDLWERNLAYGAVHAPAPAPTGHPRRKAPKER